MDQQTPRQTVEIPTADHTDVVGAVVCPEVEPNHQDEGHNHHEPNAGDDQAGNKAL